MSEESEAVDLSEAEESHSDLVELGEVKKDTRGSIFGYFFDGGAGRWG